MADLTTIHEHSSDLPIVELRHIMKTGSIIEPDELVGVGRIALRLLRRGAAEMGRRDLDEAIDRIASVLSFQSSPDFYAIHLRCLRKHLDRATELLAKVLHQPTLEEDELERLKRETIAEIITSRDDDRHLASRALRRLVFGGHPYGRTSRGTAESVSRITRDDVARFLSENLVQNNFMIGAAGDIDAETLEKKLERTIGSLPEGSGSALELHPASSNEKMKVVLVDKPERTQTQIFLGQLGPTVRDPHDLALRVALTAFGGTFTSRLMREVRVERGWSYGAYASMGRGRMNEILSLWVFPALTDAVPCLELVTGLFRDLQEKGPAPEDVTFARDYLARSMALQKDTASARLTLRLRQELLDMPRDYYDSFSEHVRQITPEQANDAVATHLTPDRLAIAITCTAAELIGPLRELLGDEVEIEIIPYDSPLLG